MSGELRQHIVGTALSLLIVEALLSLLIAATGVAVAALLFPDVISRHVHLTLLAGVIWGGGVGVGLGSLLPALRRSGAGPPPASLARVRDIEEFTRALSLIVDADDLLGNQVGKLRSMADAERAAILVSTAQGSPYTVRASRGYEAAELAGVAFGDDARLVRWLFVNETCLVPSEHPGVVEDLQPQERDFLKALRVDAVFPLVALNRLVGMVFLSREGGLSRDQREAIASFAPQVALALENAVLYEQQRLRMRRLYRADRLATTGRLAAGAAHEIRNPLTAIRSTVQYLRRGMEGDPERAVLLDDLLEETDRINAIVEGMLSFARPAEPRLEEVDLSDLVAQTVRLVEPTARKGRVEVETRCPTADPVLRADPDQLKQVLLNVMINALQAMPDGGRLGVRVSRLDPSSRSVTWKVEVSDTGVGIPAAHRERIFDPFFTTKRDGTGLGLSICHAILQAHGGAIDVESEAGKGTRVEIRV